MRQQAREGAPRWTEMMQHLDDCVVGLRALAHRDFSVAALHLDAAGRIEREVGLVASGYLSRIPDAFEAAWRLGSHEDALGELERFERAMRAVDHTALLGLAARCRALIAPITEMDSGFNKALELLAEEKDGFETARTRLLWGERLRRARRRSDARKQLTAAQEGFRLLGALAWAAQCDSELAA